MKLAVFNGSPRGLTSNTRILLDEFCKGFLKGNSHEAELAYLKETDKQKSFVEMIHNSDCIFLAFPLYTDSMPGIVKYFIESLKIYRQKLQDKKILFLVQSGFPEAVHSIYIERYLKKLAQRLGCGYIGTIIKGGVEGIQSIPASMTKKLYQAFYELGEIFGKYGRLDETITAKLRKPIRFAFYLYPVFYFLKLIGLFDSFWNNELKKNLAFEKRYDRPYE